MVCTEGFENALQTIRRNRIGSRQNYWLESCKGLRFGVEAFECFYQASAQIQRNVR